MNSGEGHSGIYGVTIYEFALYLELLPKITLGLSSGTTILHIMKDSY